MVKMDLSHLLEQREKAGNVLPLYKEKKAHLFAQVRNVTKFHLCTEWKLTVISAVHWGQRCPLDVSTEWDLLMMDSRVCSSTSRRLSTIISTSSWTDDSCTQRASRRKQRNTETTAERQTNEWRDGNFYMYFFGFLNFYIVTWDFRSNKAFMRMTQCTVPWR